MLAHDYDVRVVVDLRTEEERREKPDPEDALIDVRFSHAPVLNTETVGRNRLAETVVVIPASFSFGLIRARAFS